MKRFLVIVLTVPLLLGGCVSGFTRLSGSGNMVTEERAASGFTSIEISSSIQATLEQGDSESLLVEAEDNVIDKVETSVSDGKLTIRMKPNLSLINTEPVRVTVRLKNLNELEINSSARVTSGEIATETLTLRADSSARLEITNLTADRLDATVVSSSRVTLAGEVSKLELSADSSARFDAGDLQVADAVVKANSSSQVTLWITAALDATAGSSAKVSYYGAPLKVIENESSSGSVDALGAK